MLPRAPLRVSEEERNKEKSKEPKNQGGGLDIKDWIEAGSLSIAASNGSAVPIP
jgi:hypothetical protein